MKILAIGDIVGKAGRKVLLEKLPELRKKMALDFVVVNGENAAHGFGLNRKMYKAFTEAGADVVTMGNHTWDQKDIFMFINEEKSIVRPLNFSPEALGRGFVIHQLADGRKVAVVQLIGNLFMDGFDSAFQVIDSWLENYRLGKDLQAIVLDFHAEATSEKMAMGHFCDGRISLLYGTHTHIPTADAVILNAGTAYISDVGMTGDYDSVIGMAKQEAVRRFVSGVRVEHLAPAEGEGTLCGIFVETDDDTGLAKNILPIRLGGRIAQSTVMW